jgi:Fur family peroxide stress response transcriptional regulator
MARPVKYRESILTLLKENPIHPTVDWLYATLRQSHPHVSLATVYRTLRTLVSEGILCELPFGTSESRFGLTMEQTHYHFICDTCHKIYDLSIRPRTDLEQAVQRDTGHEVRRHTMEFYGRCRKCAEKQPSAPSKISSMKCKEKML